MGVFRGAAALLINVFFGQVLVCFFVRGAVRNSGEFRGISGVAGNPGNPGGPGIPVVANISTKSSTTYEKILIHSIITIEFLIVQETFFKYFYKDCLSVSLRSPLPTAL